MKKWLIFGVFIILAVFAAGCATKPEPPSEQEEFVDTGVLVIDSSPNGANVFVNNKLEGQTPLTLYNFPVGQYNIRLEKEGYLSFGKSVSVRVGATEEIDAKLSPIQKEQDKPSQAIPQEQKQPETAQANKINLSSFAMYHDFENKLFTSLRSEKSDVFSRKYDTYVDFVALAPAKIKIIKKPLKDVTQSDCISTDGGVAQLFSGDTLCVITTEGNFFALSGNWEKMPTELDFVRLS